VLDARARGAGNHVQFLLRYRWADKDYARDALHRGVDGGGHLKSALANIHTSLCQG
jgi:hypothetical protein